MSDRSTGSFVDHGPRADHSGGSRPQWIVEQLGPQKFSNACNAGFSGEGSQNSTCSSSCSEMLDCEDAPRAPVENNRLVSALWREKRKTRRVLRDKRRLEGEVEGLKKANISLAECNYLLAHHNSTLASSVTSLTMKCDETHIIVTGLVAQVREIDTTLRMIAEKLRAK
uniref:Uncharacterized protein n=1 Tax=Trypanosoma congolense (strain IL3000) TaxID=1068625 RepID=G0UM83_TRYCI|nr:conserved hypothetical protein [Trypanosoma congolense IL3000]